MLLILGTSVIASAQTQAAERQSLPPRGSEKYWLEVDEFVGSVVHFAHAKRFVQLHERTLTDRQCQQYSRIATQYVDHLAAMKHAEMPAQSGFWNDVRECSIRMITPQGVRIPVHRTGKYWITTGSEVEDQELRRIVSLEIDEASSQLVSTGEYSPLALNVECPNAGQERTSKDQP